MPARRRKPPSTTDELVLPEDWTKLSQQQRDDWLRRWLAERGDRYFNALLERFVVTGDPLLAWELIVPCLARGVTLPRALRVFLMMFGVKLLSQAEPGEKMAEHILRAIGLTPGAFTRHYRQRRWSDARSHVDRLRRDGRSAEEAHEMAAELMSEKLIRGEKPISADTVKKYIQKSNRR
jgi:hypothetical protein